jgi:fructoselysine-6-P-deglycase FrlB-like protein
MNDNSHTWREIQQQPALWPTTAARVRQAMERLQAQARLKDARVVITGAGTSAYVAAAVAAAWPRSAAVPSTDLLLATERYIEDPTVLVRETSWLSSTQSIVPPSPSTDDVSQVVAYAEAKGCQEAVLVYPIPLRRPLDTRIGKIRVRTLAFRLDGDLDTNGLSFVRDLLSKQPPPVSALA